MSRGIIKIMIANIFCMIISIVTNFILPKYLSIESYGIIKSYGLYIAYAGLLAFGYAEGIFLKYGGKNITLIDKDDFSNNMYTYLIFQCIVSIVLCILGIIIKSWMIIMFALGALVVNLVGYLKVIFQATGNFDEYSMSLKFEKVILFVLNILLIFLIQTNNGYIYILVQIIASIMTLIYLCYVLKKIINIRFKGKFSLSILVENIKKGFLLLIGGLTDILFTGIDRWFIKILMTVNDFSYYSFGVSLENIISVFTSPISLTLYNYFCQGISNQKIKEIKKLLLIWGGLIIALVFPAKFVIENFINKYITSVEVIFYLFAAQFFYMLIRSIYVNIYKSKDMQKFYLIQISVMTIISIILNCIFYKINESISSFAQATFITSVIWFIWCEIKEKEIRFSVKEYFSIFILLISYFVLGKYFNTICAFFVFLIIFIVCVLLFYRDSVNILKNKILQIYKEKKQNKE